MGVCKWVFGLKKYKQDAKDGCCVDSDFDEKAWKEVRLPYARILRSEQNSRKTPTPQKEFHLSQKLSLTKCSPVGDAIDGGSSKNGKLFVDCIRGRVTCVKVDVSKEAKDIKGKGGKEVKDTTTTLGCVGASAYVFSGYKAEPAHAWFSFEGGIQLEFFKWGASLFKTINKGSTPACKVEASATTSAIRFDITMLQEITVWQLTIDKHFPEVKGNNCAADQMGKSLDSKQPNGYGASMTFFGAKYCYGLPAIAKICGSVSLQGTLGLYSGAALITPSKDSLTLNLIPSAGLNLKLEVSGEAMGFKAYTYGQVGLVTGTLPASALMRFRDQDTKKLGTQMCDTSNKLSMAVSSYLGWKISFLNGKVVAGVDGPGFKGAVVRGKGCKTGKERALLFSGGARHSTEVAELGENAHADPEEMQERITSKNDGIVGCPAYSRWGGGLTARCTYWGAKIRCNTACRWVMGIHNKDKKQGCCVDEDFNYNNWKKGHNPPFFGSWDWGICLSCVLKKLKAAWGYAWEKIKCAKFQMPCSGCVVYYQKYIIDVKGIEYSGELTRNKMTPKPKSGCSGSVMRTVLDFNGK